MSDQQRLWEYVETWRSACDDLVRLARDIPEEQWLLPTDLPGWSVIDNVAHTAHLEAVLSGAAEETAPLPEGLAHVKNVSGAYTEQGVIARRGRSMTTITDELADAVAVRYAALLARPPTDGAAPAPRTPAGVPWDNERLLRNRPLDVWMHEQDIRRAIGRPGGYASPAARHSLGYLADSLPVVVGKRVQPPIGASVVLAVPDLDLVRAVEIAEDGRAHPQELTSDPTGDPASVLISGPTVRITLAPEELAVLAGGRRGVDDVAAQIDGDQELGRAVLAALAVTP